MAGHEIAGHEHDGPKMTPGREIRGEKIVLTEITVQYEVCKFLNPQHCNTLCIRDYLFLKNLALSNDETQRSSLIESSLKPMPRHFSYRSSDRLQRRNAKSIQSIHARTFVASVPVSYRTLLCPVVSCLAISCPVIWSVIFTSCNFMPCTLVLQFHVLLFHALQIGPSISRPSFSRPAFSAPPREHKRRTFEAE